MHKKTRWQFELMTLLGIPIITKLCSRQIYGHFPWKGIRRPHAKMWNETGKTSYYKTKWETTKYQFLNNPFCARFLHFYNRARHLMNGVIFRIHFISTDIGLRFPFLPSVKLYYSLALFPDTLQGISCDMNHYILYSKSYTTKYLQLFWSKIALT